MSEHTRPSATTRAEEAQEARQPAGAGDFTEEEAELVDGHRVDPEVAATEKAQYERGANVEGEGRIP